MGAEQLSFDGVTEGNDKVLRFLSGGVGDAGTAEDILQSAYVKAIEHGSELRDEESTVAWFYRILGNAVTDHYRRGATRAKALEAFGAEAVESYEPELQAEACACINEVIRDLKPEYRAAIEQVDLAGESIEALARSQGTTANSASVRLHRARKSVAKNRTALSGTCANHKCVDS